MLVVVAAKLPVNVLPMLMLVPAVIVGSVVVLLHRVSLPLPLASVVTWPTTMPPMVTSSLLDAAPPVTEIDSVLLVAPFATVVLIGVPQPNKFLVEVHRLGNLSWPSTGGKWCEGVMAFY